jgi:6-phosphogluconolactonase (cycloisomerase 2 family)
MRPSVRALAAVAAFVTFASAAPAAAKVDPTTFSQLSGQRGCLMQIGYPIDHGCARVAGMWHAQGIAMSPDERFVYVASGGSLSGGSNGVTIFRRLPRTGGLVKAGCVTATSGDGRAGTEGICNRGDALLGATGIAMSPDGRTLFVAAAKSGGVAWLARNPETGALVPSGCVKDAPREDRCGAVSHLAGAAAVAVAPDGRDLYVASPGTSALHVMRLDPDGAPRRVQCLSETGFDGACDTAPGMARVDELAVSPDGLAVYTVGQGGIVTAFARDPATGRLAETMCLLDASPGDGPCVGADGIRGAAAVAVSPDSRDVYVVARRSQAVTSFHVESGVRLRQTGCLQRTPRGKRPREKRCHRATAVWSPREVVVTGDGRTVFAGGADTVTSFRRDPATGRLVQTGCAEEEQSSKSCREVRATFGINALAASADGRNVYVTADAENAVAVLRARP